jgi:hypothetical protein
MIELGLNVPNFGPGTTPATLRSWVQFAEETGFSLAMMSDHVAPTPDVTALYPAPFYDPFTTLSWLASYTTRLSLGTSVAILQNGALPRLADAAASLGKPTPRLSPRIKARFTTHDLTRPDRPLGVGSLSQIGDDLVLLDRLGADTVVLDTNPDHPDQRQPAAGDWRTLRKIAEWAEDRGLLTSGSSRGYQPLHQGA